MNIFDIKLRGKISWINKYHKSLQDVFSIPTTFDEWKILEDKKIQERKDAYLKTSISLLQKMDRPHTGSIHYKNKNKFLIEIKNVNKWYFNKLNNTFQQVLHNVNLEIKEGEFVVILGESGSGKTTLLNILSGLERPSNGQAIVANHNLITMSEKQLTNFRKEYVSIIFQNYALISDLTIKDNIEFGSYLQENARKRVDIDQLTQDLSITTQKNKLPSQLSGGQQQRSSIAKALAKNPKILLADEPTGAVDEKTCVDILKIIIDINSKYKTTIVLITHNNLIAEIANRVIKIKKGKIVETILQTPKTIESINWRHD